MKIVLQYNKSEKNKLTKTVTQLAEVTGTLKNATSVIDPVFIVRNMTLANIKQCNYATIASFGRSYFVTGITSVREGLWEISCHVDVLSTYADQIRALPAVIRRQEYKYNLYLDDGVFKTYQNPNIITKAFPSGFDTQSFVLAIAGS